jgi:membrane associated rhomboid family serine protease
LASLPAWIFIVVWFLYQFFSLSFENMAMIAYSAHLGGFIAGLLLIKKFSSRKKLF